MIHLILVSKLNSFVYTRILVVSNLERIFILYILVKLDAGEEEPSNENEGYIEFKVTLRARENTATLAGGANLPGQETVITERSRFLRDSNTGSWSYASGDVRSDVAGLEDTTLN